MKSMLSKLQFTKTTSLKIKEARKLKKMSQEELAHKAGLYRTYVGHLENARYSPSAYVLYKIAEALNLPVKDLLP